MEVPLPPLSPSPISLLSLSLLSLPPLTGSSSARVQVGMVEAPSYSIKPMDDALKVSVALPKVRLLPTRSRDDGKKINKFFTFAAYGTIRSLCAAEKPI